MAVPTVDLSRDPAAVAGAIDAACRDVGFFQIVGHGIDPEVEGAAWNVAHEFFALPLDEKLAVAIPPGDAYGYGPFKIERLAASLAYCALMIYGSSLFVDRLMTLGTNARDIPLPRWVLTGIMPIAFGLLAIRLVQAARAVLWPRRGATPPS